MAQRRHTNDGERFEVLVQLSHVDVGLVIRSYAGVTVFREVFEATAFNIFDPSTWFGGGRWVRRGDPAAIVGSTAFFDAAGNDISARLNLFETDRPGHFGRFALFVFWRLVGNVTPEELGNDARSVERVRLEYRLPWEAESRVLEQT